MEGPQTGTTNSPNETKVESMDLPFESCSIKDSPYSSPETINHSYSWPPLSTPTSTNGGGGFSYHESLPSDSPSPPDDNEQQWEDSVQMTAEGDAIYKCDVCGFSSPSRFQYNSHMSTHTEHKCSHCDYTSRTEGRLKRHIREFHAEAEMSKCCGKDSDGEMVMSSSSISKKSRNYRCKQCEFVGNSKSEFWRHSRVHIKEDKILQCSSPNCEFVTEYKHHLEYHMRNHMGSKPFKCSRCEYTCVNKSMLNSHMKSHSNIYQYRCANCNYATKYCHSLKLHVRKYGHKLSVILNSDGTPANSTIDAYGNRRGPKNKKAKYTTQQQGAVVNGENLIHSNSQAQDMELKPPIGFYPFPPPAPPPVCLPFVSSMNGVSNSIFLSQPSFQHSQSVESSKSTTTGTVQSTTTTVQSMKCNLCEFSSEAKDIFSDHMLAHATKENEDLCRLYGITAESLMINEAVHPYLSLYFKNGYIIKQDTNYISTNGASQSLHELHKKTSCSPQKDGNFVLTNGASPPDLQERSNKGAYSPKSHAEDSKEDGVSRVAPPVDYVSVSPFENRLTEPAVLPLDLSSCKNNSKGAKIDVETQQKQSRSRRKGSVPKARKYIHPEFENDLEDRIVDDMHVIHCKSYLKTHKLNGHHGFDSTNNTKSVVLRECDTKEDKRLSSSYTCTHCEMSFKDCAMYTMHMGYHGIKDPFTCNVCGHETKDKLAFFMHIARVAHV